MNLTSTTTAPHSALFDQMPLAWWRRWWPALAPAAVSVACAVVITVQQAEISRLKEAGHTATSAAPTATTPLITPTTYEGANATAIDPSAAEQDEITRLRERVKQLTAEISQLEQTQKENEELRRQVAAPPTLTQEEIDALTKAKEQALSIRCINNLKQFGLAVRIWMLDNNEVLPPDTLSMSNELSTPKILVCPADTNRPAARDWASFTTVNLSYEYLAPSARNADHEPTRVLSRCPIHGHVGLCDGSVHGQVARSHPEWLIERDGKLYMENDPQSGQSTRRPR
ncbi:MAG TPA: hypothetical protein VFZ59_09265 [Verrucomicrobiae bacterium]|nr:hypothetical protein [Verrucomicrobiae bacterium]